MLPLLLSAALSLSASPPPNVVLILADDLGYGDIGCFGATDVRTPNLDRMAREGTRFTSFYVAQAVCTASRAALMTGCYPNRVGLAGALNHTSNVGIHPDELLLPEILKTQGYSTAIFGKWHLGTRSAFNPLRHGFDEYLGIPYSNDNSKYHPIVRDMPPLPLYDGEQIVETDPDQSQFTRRFAERAVQFIENNADKPFFLYVPHVMPHVPIFASEPFRGKSKRGLYGDVIEELDWSVGQILDAIHRHDLDQRTLVMFLSDNGPFLSYGDHAGSSGRLREGKLTTFEGGMRVPCIMRWPASIPAGRQCDVPWGTIDLLPTLTSVAGGKLPDARIDGRDQTDLMLGKSDTSPHDSFFYYSGNELQAVRSGKWKLHFPHDYLTSASPPGRNGKPANFANLKPASITQSGIRGIATRHGYEVKTIELSLFDLEADVGETRNVASEHPQVVARLTALADLMRADLGDELTGAKPAHARTAGVAE